MLGGGALPKRFDGIVFTLAVGGGAAPKGFVKVGFTLVAGGGVAPKIFDEVVFTFVKGFTGGEALLVGVFVHNPFRL